MYLDCDTTPPIAGQWTSRGGLNAAIRRASAIIAKANEGQIGIFDKYCGAIFYGYVIKYPGQEPYFEAAE